MKIHTNLQNDLIRLTILLRKPIFLTFIFSAFIFSNIHSESSPDDPIELAAPIDPIAICQDFSTSLDFSGTKFISPQNVNGGSFDPDGNIVSFSLDQDLFTCDDLGVNVVTLTVEDNDGNTASCTANVTISFPSQTLACISQVNLSLGIDGTGTLEPEDVLAGPFFDPCDLFVVTPSFFTCDDIGPNTVTVEDGQGNFCWLTVIVEDKIPPSFIYPEDVTVQCNSSTDPSDTGEPVIIDNCGQFGISYDDQIFNLSGDNIKILREWTIIDWLTGDTEVYIQVIKTEDNQSPTAICVANINVALDQFGMATLNAEDIDAGSYDDCGDVSLDLDQEFFDCSDIGETIIVFLTVTDESGNTNQCWTNVIIEDKMGPTAVCNAQVNVSLGADGTATITPDVIDAGSYDNCGPLTYALSDSIFDCTDIGDSLVILLTVTDASGNTNQCWTEIVVEDKLAPEVTCPADLTLDCSQAGNLDPLDTGTPFVVDNCDLIGYSYEDQYLPLGGASVKILRTWTVVDWYSGSIQECIQVITVLDITPPGIVCVSQINASLDFSGALTLNAADLVINTSDDCDSVSLSVFPNQFDCGDLGDTTVTVTAIDGSGNISECNVDVTIEDKTSPIAICNSVVNVSLGADGTATITPDVIDAGSFDECGPVTLAINLSTFDCTDIGDSIVVILTVTDQSGNTNQCWTEINVEDKMPPIVTCPFDLTIECSQAGDLDPAFTGSPTVDDNCGLIGYSYEDQLFELDGANYKVIRDWVIVDWNSGTFDSCTQVITVLDITPPEIICLTQLSASLDANGFLTLFPADLDAGTTDICGDFELSISQSQFSCANIGSNTVTLTATDENGNSSQCDVEVIISGMDSDGDGFTICDGDCNDNDGSISPGASEVCGDNIDNNCNGRVDENCICTSFAQSTQYEWIETITVNSTTNTSGDDGGYGDYTSIVIPMNQGSNAIELTPGFAGSSYNEFWSIWIDLNQNGVYENSEEVLAQSSFGTINSSISIPTTALLGTTTMRISMKYGNSSDPCEIFAEGEVEDYTVFISEPEYCISQGQSTQYEWIKKVRLKSIDNLSGNNNGYADFTSLSTNLNPGQSKNIKLKPGFSGNSYLEHWRVWVDWNEDGDFDDAGELEVQIASTGNVTQQITVPNTASGGNKIMRVSMKYGGYPDPCEEFTYGEVEDYTIFVTGSNPLVDQDNSPAAIELDNGLSLSSENIETRDRNSEFSIFLYPNPATNYINIEINSSIESNTKLTMYNQVGQVVYQSITELNNHKIDVTSDKFINGMYIVIIQQGEKVISKKLLITK